jgi:hypothetical protein
MVHCHIFEQLTLADGGQISGKPGILTAYGKAYLCIDIG